MSDPPTPSSPQRAPMPRQQQDQQRRNKQKKQNVTEDLVNFRFAPPERRSTTRNTITTSRGNKTKKKPKKQLVRYTPPQAFPLYASSIHSFYMKPTFNKKRNNGAIPSWDDVAMVKCFTYLEEPTCPICLDTIQAPRITKCGHVYCLPCLQRHVYSMECSSSGKTRTTCPCCSVSTYSGDWKLVEFTTVHPPLVGNRIQMVKLHKSSLNNIPYRPTTSTTKQKSPSAILSDKSSTYCRFNPVQESKYRKECMSSLNQLQQYKSTLNDATEACFVDIAIQFVQERELSVVGKEILDGNVKKGDGQHERFEETAAAVEIHAQLEKKGPRRGKQQRKKKQQQPSVFLPEGETHFYQSADGQVCFLSALNMKCLTTEFATHENEASVEDKQDEATASDKQGEAPKEQSSDSPKQSQKQKKPTNKSKPLPDTIEATVLHVEHVQLTPNNTRPFLSHLPMYMDVMFVELDLNHLLSANTKKQFHTPLNRRKQERQAVKRAEKRMDRLTLKKEQERIEERKARLQLIEPNDEFFQPAVVTESVSMDGDDFGPVLSTSPTSSTSGGVVLGASNSTTSQAAAFRFSQVCATNGVWPELNITTTTSVASSPPQNNRGTVAWGSSSRRRGQVPSTNPVENTYPPSPPPDATKKRGKKKKEKIVLFSTGGGRAY